jgi:hypothetical protein
MAPITWPWLIAAARRGEPQLLLDFLDNCDGLSPAHYQDLSKLFRDTWAGNLDRPSHRAKLSPETRAHVFHKRTLHARAILDQIREIERRRGKQLRGKDRVAAFNQIRKRLPPQFRATTYDDVAWLAKHAKSWRR